MGRLMIFVVISLCAIQSVWAGSNTFQTYIGFDESGSYEVHLRLNYSPQRRPELVDQLILEGFSNVQTRQSAVEFKRHYPPGSTLSIAGLINITGYSSGIYAVSVTNNLKDIDDGEVCVSIPTYSIVFQHNAKSEPFAIQDVCYGLDIMGYMPGYIEFDLRTRLAL